MAGRRAHPNRAEACAQEQVAEDTPVFSLRSTTECLLYVENSLGEIRGRLDSLQESVETLIRRL